MTSAAIVPSTGARRAVGLVNFNTAQLRSIGEVRYTGCVGQRMEILVEGPSKRNPARMMGRTRCNRIVVFEGSERHRGQVMSVDITRAGSYTLYGDPAVLPWE